MFSVSKNLMSRLKRHDPRHAVLPPRRKPAPPDACEEAQLLREELELHRVEIEQQNRDFIRLYHQLETSHNAYVDLYEFAPILYITLDRLGIIHNINMKGARLLGRNDLHLLNKRFSDYVAAADQPLFSGHLKHCANTTGEVITELRILAGSRGEVPMQLTSIRVRDAHLPMAVFPTAMIDLTERKKIERNLLRREEELHHARQLEAIRRLAGGVAHDFNNMITGIHGLSNELRETLPEKDARRSTLDDISRTCQRAFTLTRQLLAFGRRQVIRPIALNVNQVVRNMENLLRPLIGENIELTTDLAGDRRAIQADEGQLEQVIMNLVVNSRDALPEGGRIQISTRREFLPPELCRPQKPVKQDHYVCLKVTDNGVGMEEATQQRIFEPYFSHKTQGTGTGLGLATVHGIVKQAGGEIRVWSRLGQGTTFEIYLLEVDEAAHVERRTDARALRPGTETILLVEDEPIVRRVTGRLLKQQGYKILSAESAEEALTVSRRHPEKIDLLLTDVIMPGRNGRSLAKDLSQERPGLRILYMSGYPEDYISQHGILQPEVAFIEKSQILRNLAYRVRALLDVPTGKTTQG